MAKVLEIGRKEVLCPDGISQILFYSVIDKHVFCFVLFLMVIFVF